MGVMEACICAVCLELFTDPRVLSCGHTYCQKCIEPLLEGAWQRSAQCPECRSKNKQPANGFPVNYGMLGVVGQLEGSTDTRSTGTCNSCAKGAPMSDLFSCTTCRDNSATAVDAEFLICGTCIARKHKGHDYEELDITSKADIDEVLQKVQGCREAYDASKKTVHDKKVDIVSAIERFEHIITQFPGTALQLLGDRKASLAAITDDLRSDDALTKRQLMSKLNEYEKYKNELEEVEFVAAFAALEECHRRLSGIPALAAFAAAEGNIRPRVIRLPKTDEGLGFNIKGCIEYNVPIHISRIIPGGAADRNGGLRRGDQLVAINGINVEHALHETAVRLLKGAKDQVELVVRYSPQLIAEVERLLF